MRTLNQLYTILYDSIKDEERIGGLCGRMVKLCNEDYITRAEYDILYEHFESQKPTPNLHPEFYAHYCYRGGVWWWGNTYYIEESTQQRKLFIKKMIEITKE